MNEKCKVQISKCKMGRLAPVGGAPRDLERISPEGRRGAGRISELGPRRMAAVCWAACGLRLKGFEDRLRLLVHHAQQGLGWPFRFAASLLPVLKGGFIDADHEGELGL